MSGDARELELDKTAQAPVALDQTKDASVPPLAAGTADTTAAPGSAQATPIARYASTARTINLVITAIAIIDVIYFVSRFLLSDAPPTLHKAYLGEVHGGPFAAMDVFDGPLLTLVRVTLVAVVFIVMSAWAAHHHRRDAAVQIMAATAALSGQASLAVAVLTSSETLLVWRALAAGLYVLMPLAAFTICSVFPNGRPVPRWSVYVVPIGMIPFVIQAWIMFADRGFSVPVAMMFFPFSGVFLGLLWHRYRKHATLRERHQIKWLSYGGAVFISLQLVVIAMIPLLDDRHHPAFPFVRVLFELLLGSSYLLALACLLFSAARYRLWDIDRVINRTLVYVVVTGLLGAASALGYFGLRAILAGIINVAAVSAAISIAIMVALFAPTRRRISRWIDRRFYGIGLDYEALAAKAVRAAHTTLPTTGTELGAYDELVLLGRGGMGAVYRAHHADFGVPVALKVMSPQLAGDSDAQARFRREGQILEDLQHPNVIPFLASGHEAGLAFIAMQYVDGEDLGAVLRRTQRLSVADTVAMISGVAAALDLAHTRGVVHRDIKPANVFVEGNVSQPLALRRALVMDFGVARIAGDPSAGDGSLVGSLPYVAPEQIHDGDQVDGRADIYALGATTYELLTGRPPFIETTALGLVLAHLHQPPADPRTLEPTLPEPVAAAVMKALAKEPDQRFATAGAFASELRRAASLDQ